MLVTNEQRQAWRERLSRPDIKSWEVPTTVITRILDLLDEKDNQINSWIADRDSWIERYEQAAKERDALAHYMSQHLDGPCNQLAWECSEEDGSDIDFECDAAHQDCWLKWATAEVREQKKEMAVANAS